MHGGPGRWQTRAPVSITQTQDTNAPTDEAPTAPADDVELLVPADDVAEPEVSIVIPALNEEITIDEFVAWCRQGLRDAGVVGEILIVDSSIDATTERALAGGARVLRVPKRGLGRAYIDAIPYIRGKYVIMGDADCTYDFRQLAPFVAKLREGYEFVMGTRFKGYIEPGSMPKLHRYAGTPITTWILNRVYSTKFSDIHCGMRAITLDGLKRIDLRSQSWEYASEMVLKSVHHELRTTEVPVRFLKDQEGRVSHHKRLGWFSPFQAAWINLRAMFVYGADFFVFRPGLALLSLGLVLVLPLTFGQLDIGPVHFSLYWQLLGMTLGIIGLQGVMLGCLTKVFFDFNGQRTNRIVRLFSYTRAVLVAFALFVVGISLGIPLLATWLSDDLRLSAELDVENYLGVTGLFLMICGFTLFVFTLIINAAALVVSDRLVERQ